MRYLILSDIHANMEAFEAVLAAAKDLAYDRTLVLGDLVGYGADPNAVIDKVRAMAPYRLIRGNHDKVGSGVESAEGFNAVARNAIRWTYDSLTAENREWLAALPQGPSRRRRSDRDLPRHAVRRGRLRLRRSRRAARDAGLGAAGLPVRPHPRAGRLHADRRSVHAEHDGRRAAADHLARRQGGAAPDQPRLGRPAARRRPARRLRHGRHRRLEITIYRTEYPIAEAQARIIAAGLPAVLAQRLALGR